MKFRTDSPFAHVTEKQAETILALSENLTLDQLLTELESYDPPIECSEASLRRFLKRLKREKFLREAEEDNEELVRFAERAQDPRLTTAALDAARQRLYEMAADTEDQATVVAIFKELREERDKDRALRVQEENAKLGWRKLELQKAESAVRLLPKLRELLSDASAPAQERVERALACLTIREEGGTALAAVNDK